MKFESLNEHPAVRSIPYMGVINVVAEASKLGFFNGNPDWSNMGQGQPEVGQIEGAPERLLHVEMDPHDAAYGHINGIQALREAVAEHYNKRFRKNSNSKYSAENVAIASGGRLMLSRVFAVLNGVPVGYQTPDYTAYQEMLEYHLGRFVPVHLRADEEDAFRIPPQKLAREIEAHGLGAFVVSNPCNPTGQVIAGEELAAYVKTCRAQNCLFVADEFYSHFIYNTDGSPGDGPVSAASVIDDVEADPVLIIDGITKNLRYPGVRLSWAVGPKPVIDAIGRAASAIDGGPSTAAQRFALKVLEDARFDQETTAVRNVFARKRRLMIEALTKMGVRFVDGNTTTFYLWGDVSGLPKGLNTGAELYRAALQERVMLVPGEYFDVNPMGLRKSPSRLRHWVRFSFGPSEANMLAGLERLAKVVGRGGK